MKKLLYILLVIKILAALFAFFSILGANIGLAIVMLAIGFLEIIVIIAVIRNMDEIEELWYSLNRVRHDIKVIDDNIEKPQGEKSAPSIDRREAARGAWECIKCATVNKSGTDSCSNCGAEYSVWDNPTASPNAKKKLSRWVK